MPKRTLTNAQVLDIYRRAHAGEPATDLAAEYGVTRETISGIKNGRIHRRLTGHDRSMHLHRRNGRAKLSDEDVLAIYRQSASRPAKDLAQQHGVDPSRVWKIAHGVDWTWLTGHQQKEDHHV